VYDNKSALEQMHCMLLLVVMRYNGMAHLVEHSESDMPFRKLLSSSVLATDMSVHVDFMNRFKALIDGDYERGSLSARKVLICQALIKCADISNPVRYLLLLGNVSLTLRRVDHIGYRSIGLPR
jgi:hypothetical protein